MRLHVLALGIGLLPIVTVLAGHRPSLGSRCKHTGQQRCAIDRSTRLKCVLGTWTVDEVCGPGCCFRQSGDHAMPTCITSDGDKKGCLYRDETDSDDETKRGKLATLDTHEAPQDLQSRDVFTTSKRPSLHDKCKASANGTEKCGIDRTTIIRCDGEHWVRAWRVCEAGCCFQKRSDHVASCKNTGLPGGCLDRDDSGSDFKGIFARDIPDASQHLQSRALDRRPSLGQKCKPKKEAGHMRCAIDRTNMLECNSIVGTWQLAEFPNGDPMCPSGCCYQDDKNVAPSCLKAVDGDCLYRDDTKKDHHDLVQVRSNLETLEDPLLHILPTRCNDKNMTQILRWVPETQGWILHFNCEYKDTCKDVKGIGACYIGNSLYLVPAANASTVYHSNGTLDDPGFRMIQMCNPANSSESLKFNSTHYVVDGVCHYPRVCHDFSRKAGFTFCAIPGSGEMQIDQHGIWEPLPPVYPPTPVPGLPPSTTTVTSHVVMTDHDVVTSYDVVTVTLTPPPPPPMFEETKCADEIQLMVRTGNSWDSYHNCTDGYICIMDDGTGKAGCRADNIGLSFSLKSDDTATTDEDVDFFEHTKFKPMGPRDVSTVSPTLLCSKVVDDHLGEVMLCQARAYA